RSLTRTLVAVSGPLFVSVTVKVTVSPTLGVWAPTGLVRLRTACWVVVVAVLLLLVVSGANWSEPLTLAGFGPAPGLSTRAWMVSVGAPPDATDPTIQTPLALS